MAFGISEDKTYGNYWSSATVEFTNDWTYLFSGRPVAAEHWARDSFSYGRQQGPRKCAAMTPTGLYPYSCSVKHYYVCEKF